MKMRWLIVGFVVAAVLVLGWVGRDWYAGVKREKLRLLEVDLDKPDPNERLHAAEVILRLDPVHAGARMARVKASLALGNMDAVRAGLRDMLDDETFPDRKELFLLQFETLLNESADMIDSSTPASSDLTETRVTPMLDEAASARKELAEMDMAPREAVIMEARELDQRAELLHLRMRAARLDLARSTSAMLEVEADRLNREMLEMARSIKTTDQRLASICESARQSDHSDVRPLVPIFHTQLRARAFDAARKTAGRISVFDVISDSLATDVADSLLNIERLYGEPESPEDIDTAERLLTHPSIKHSKDLRLRLTLSTLRLRQRRFEDANAIATEILQSFDGHPRATCIRARALTGLDRPEEAMTILSNLNEKFRSADIFMAMAEACRAMRSEDRAIPFYRQALQKDPDNLRARIGLIESSVRTTGINDAEPDIRIAMKLNPGHPLVRSLRSQLLVERCDPQEIRTLIRDRVREGAWTPAWLDVAIAVSLALDDTVLTTRFIGLAKQQTPNDLVLIAEQAVKYNSAERLDSEGRQNREKLAQASWNDADHRAETAFAMVRALHKLMPADPLAEAGPVPSEALQMAARHAAAASATADPNAAPWPIDPRDITQNIFLADTTETASELLKASIARWPARAELRELQAQVELWLNRPEHALAASKRVPDDLALEPALLGAIKTHASRPTGEATDASLNSQDVSPTAMLIKLRTTLAAGDKERTTRELSRLLAAHPRAEPACLLVLADVAKRNKPAEGDALLQELEKVSPKVSRLAMARWLVATSRPGDALTQSNVYLRGEDRDSHVRRRATEVAVRAKLALGASEQAASFLESLGTLVTDDRIELRLASIDARLASKRLDAASSEMSRMLATPDIPMRELDMMLARAFSFMDRPRFTNFVETVLTADPASQLARLYKAESLRAENKHDDAMAIARSVFEANPQMARAAVLCARLDARAGRLDDAKKMYASAVKLDGPAADTASAELELIRQGKPIPEGPYTQGGEK